MSVIISETLGPKRLVGGVASEMKLLAPFFAAAGFYILGVLATARFTGLDSYFRLSLYQEAAGLTAVLAVPIGLLAYLIYLLASEREKHPLARLGRDITAHILAPRRLITWILSLVTLCYFISAFSSFKTMIAALNPFYLDRALAGLDDAIHLGIAPWKITHFLFGGLYPTLTLNIAYNAWFFVMCFFTLAQTLALTGSRNRARYLLSFVLCWIVIGSILAVALSSAGPCYYGRVTGLADLFAPLMQHLAALDSGQAAAGSYWRLWSLALQDRLWSDQFLSTSVIGSGISAMPSMHVSVAVLIALSAYRINRWFGRAMFAYGVIILVASVHLGWHYAVDGYASAAVTWLIWRLSGRIVERVGFDRERRLVAAEH